ncbi:hypothetical protein GCM10007052_34470 [Halioglobus japonicus]|nr:hypothetical protein GCM10007052_34470 [Halioglobus japonicus]
MMLDSPGSTLTSFECPSISNRYLKVFRRWQNGAGKSSGYTGTYLLETRLWEEQARLQRHT